MKTWAEIEVDKIKKTAKQAGFKSVTNNVLIFALAHRLAKANRRNTQLEKLIKH